MTQDQCDDHVDQVTDAYAKAQDVIAAIDEQRRYERYNDLRIGLRAISIWMLLTILLYIFIGVEDWFALCFSGYVAMVIEMAYIIFVHCMIIPLCWFVIDTIAIKIRRRRMSEDYLTLCTKDMEKCEKDFS